MTVLAWGAAGASLDGHHASGDRGLVVEYPGGALVAVIDGLGHGPEAERAAIEAEKVLVEAPYAQLVELVVRCHEMLRKTRGAVMSLASFEARSNTMTWLGIGNVEGVLLRAREGAAMEAVAMRGGTVGFQLPPLNPRAVPVEPGDTLVLASDGVRHGFRAEIVPSRTPQQIADQVIAQWAKPTDDSCVVVARYLGVATDAEVGTVKT